MNKVGNIKTRGRRQHSWLVGPKCGDDYTFASVCGYGGFGLHEIDFDSDKPACKECFKTLQRRQKKIAKDMENLQIPIAGEYAK